MSHTRSHRRSSRKSRGHRRSRRTGRQTKSTAFEFLADGVELALDSVKQTFRQSKKLISGGSHTRRRRRHR